MAMVKGAGSSEMRDNPRVTSKFDRMHGRPRVPGSVSEPGGVARPGGAGNSGAAYHGSGHQKPKEVTPEHSAHKVTHHHPSSLGSNMLEDRGLGESKNSGHTDRYPESSK